MDINTYRLQFPVVERVAYLNHAAVAPLSLRCQARMTEYLIELSSFGASYYHHRIIGTLDQARARAAELIMTEPQHVFFVRSTTQGLGIVATGLRCREGDNVVLVEKEFPANIRPWLPLRRRGVEIRFTPQRQGRVLLDDLAALMDRRTQLVAISFVQFLSGFRIDLSAVADLCRKHDALLVVDGIQGLGAFPLDVEEQGVDVLSADGHKWLLGPEGVGIGYVSPRALSRIEPALEGWLSVIDPVDFLNIEQPLKSTAARFEEGAYNMVGIFGLLGSLELIQAAGLQAIESRIVELTDLLVERLQGLGWKVCSPRDCEQEKSGIVLAERSGVDMMLLKERLAQAGVIVSLREGKLRVSPHAYNTVEELERLFEVMEKVGSR